jgi:hypothetical protein
MAVIEDENFAGLFLGECLEISEAPGMPQSEALKDPSTEVDLKERIVCRDHCTPEEKERATEKDIITKSEALNRDLTCCHCRKRLSDKLITA